MMKLKKLEKYIHTMRYKIVTQKVSDYLGKMSLLIVFLFYCYFIFDFVFDFKAKSRISLSLSLIILLFTYLIFSFFKIKSFYKNNLSSDRSLLHFLEKKLNVSIMLLQFYDLLLKRKKDSKNSLLEKAILQIEKKIIKEKILVFPKIKKNKLIYLLFLPLLLLFNSDGQFFIKKFIFFTEEFKRTPQYTIVLNKLKWEKAYRDTLSIKAKIQGKRIPPNLNLIKTYQDKKQDTLTVPILNNKFIHLNQEAIQNHFFYLTDGIACSDTGIVKVIHYPEIKDLQLIITPPKYTNLPRRNLSDQSFITDVIAGSKITFIINTIHSDTLLLEGKNKTKKFLSKKNHFEISLKLNKNTSFTISSKKELFVSQKKRRIEIEVYGDEYPFCEILNPVDGTFLKEFTELEILGVAEDDFEIKNLKVIVEKELDNSFLQGIGLKVTPLKIEEEIDLVKLTAGRYVGKRTINLKPLNLLADDKLKIYLKAIDNDKIAGFKESKSAVIHLKVPSVDALFKNSNKQISNQTDSLRKMQKEAKSFNKMLKKLSGNIKVGKKMNWEQKKILEKGIKNEKNLLKQGSKIEKEIEKSIKQLADKNLLDKETLQKYGKLKNLLNEFLNSSFSDKLKKLLEGNKEDQISKKDMVSALDEMINEQKKFKDGLDKALKILEKLKFEQNLQALIKSYEELAKEQKKILENWEKEKLHNVNKHSKRQQEKIQSNTKSLNDLKKSLPEFKSKRNLPKKLDDILNQNKKFRNKKLSQKFNNNFKQSNHKQGSKESNELVKELTSLADNLSCFKQELVNQEKEKYLKLLKEYKRIALFLSFEIENLSKKYKDLSSSSTKSKVYFYFFNNNSVLFDNLDEAIKVIARETFYIDNKIMGSLFRIDYNFNRIQKSLASKYFNTVSKKMIMQMGEFNYLASCLEKISQDIKQSESITGLQEMMKKLEEMAKKQQELNKKSQSMMSGGQKKPGMSGMPGKGSLGQQMMSQLAEEQLSLQRQMENLMKQYGGNPGEGGKSSKGKPKQGKNGKESSGDLGKKLGGFTKSMEEIAKKMQDKIFNKTTKKMQDKLLYGMLKTVKSYKQKEESQKRESQKVDLLKQFKQNPALFYKDSTKILLEKSLMDDYTSKYRKLIKEYFKKR